MIFSVKHKGFRQFYEIGTTAGILPSHKNRIRMMLVALDTAARIEDMDISGFRLHQLKGNRKGIWSISVSGNWRITFKFENGQATVVNYEDYH